MISHCRNIFVSDDETDNFTPKLRNSTTGDEQVFSKLITALIAGLVGIALIFFSLRTNIIGGQGIVSRKNKREGGIQFVPIDQHAELE